MRVLFLGGLGVAALCYQIVSFSNQLQVTNSDAEKILVAETAIGSVLPALESVMRAPDFVPGTHSWPGDQGNCTAPAIPKSSPMREDDSNTTGYWRQ